MKIDLYIGIGLIIISLIGFGFSIVDFEEKRVYGLILMFCLGISGVRIYYLESKLNFALHAKGVV